MKKWRSYSLKLFICIHTHRERCANTATHAGVERITRQRPHQANRIVAEIEANNFIVHQRTGNFQRQILNVSEYNMAGIPVEIKQKQEQQNTISTQSLPPVSIILIMKIQLLSSQSDLCASGILWESYIFLLLYFRQLCSLNIYFFKSQGKAHKVFLSLYNPIFNYNSLPMIPFTTYSLTLLSLTSYARFLLSF